MILIIIVHVFVHLSWTSDCCTSVQTKVSWPLLSLTPGQFFILETCEVPGKAFFHFLAAKQESVTLNQADDSLVVDEDNLKPDAAVFNLGTVQFIYGGHDRSGLFQRLLQIQSKAVNEIFFEKLKGNASVDLASAKLPGELCTGHFDVETDWWLSWNCEWGLGLGVKQGWVLHICCFYATACSCEIMSTNKQETLLFQGFQPPSEPQSKTTLKGMRTRAVSAWTSWKTCNVSLLVWKLRKMILWRTLSTSTWPRCQHVVTLVRESLCQCQRKVLGGTRAASWVKPGSQDSKAKES